MSRESYIRGFCKIAEAHGVDPRVLAKYAEDAVVSNQRTRSIGPRLLGMHQAERDNFTVPTDMNGGTGWLNSSEPVSMGNLSLPKGTASLTNSPNATVQQVVESGGSTSTNSIPVWSGSRNIVNGVGQWSIANPNIRQFLNRLSKEPKVRGGAGAKPKTAIKSASEKTPRRSIPKGK